MPELPEVETTAHGLRTKVLGRTFVDVWSDWKKTIKKPRDFEIFKKELKGGKIKKVWRRAKNIILDLSGGYSLLIHQKMTGHLLYGIWEMREGVWRPTSPGPLAERINGFIHVMFFLDNGRMVALSDVRKFAKIELWKSDELINAPEFLRLGPEPLEKDFTLEKFKACFIKKKGRVKQVIMNPEIIAGIGNIYASEALWRAKIHPEKDVSRLSEAEYRALYRAICKVLSRGVELGGESFDDYRDVNGERGNFDVERRVYQREREKCRRCGAPIARLQFGGRSAFYCPHCQKL